MYIINLLALLILVGKLGGKIDWYILPWYVCADWRYGVGKGWYIRTNFWDPEQESGSQDQNYL